MSSVDDLHTCNPFSIRTQLQLNSLLKSHQSYQIEFLEHVRAKLRRDKKGRPIRNHGHSSSAAAFSLTLRNVTTTTTIESNCRSWVVAKAERKRITTCGSANPGKAKSTMTMLQSTRRKFRTIT